MLPHTAVIPHATLDDAMYSLFMHIFVGHARINSAVRVNDSFSLQFKDIANFMQATTSEISVAPKVSLLAHVRNPCFAVTSQHWNAVNISLATAVKHHMTIKCLPYVYLLGKYFLSYLS